MNVVFFDLETSGLDPQRHAIIQVAALAVNFDTLSVLESFERKIRFRIENADRQALEVNSYNKEVWEREAVSPAAAELDLTAFLKSHADMEMISAKSGAVYRVAQLVGHNADRFDGPFLQAWYKRLGAFLPASFSVLDSCQYARWFYAERRHLCSPENFKLETLCQHLGLPGNGEYHDAMADVNSTLQLVRKLREMSRNNQ